MVVVFGAKSHIIFTVHGISCIHNDNVPTTTVSTASIGLTLLHQRQCSPIIYHYSTASTASIGLTFLHQRHCPHHHIPLFHYVHHTYWFDLFAPNTMFPPPYTTILLHPLHGVWVDLFSLKAKAPPLIFTVSTALVLPF